MTRHAGRKRITTAKTIGFRPRTTTKAKSSFRQGQSTKTLDLYVVDDDLFEDVEDIDLTLEEYPGYGYGYGYGGEYELAPNLDSATAHIIDDIDDVELQHGVFVAVNDDYDEQNSKFLDGSPPGDSTSTYPFFIEDNQPDRTLEHRIAENDNELRLATLTTTSPSSVIGTLTWTIPNGVKVWWRRHNRWVEARRQLCL